MPGYPSSPRILVAQPEDLPSGKHTAFQLAWKYWLCFPLTDLSDSGVGWSLHQSLGCVGYLLRFPAKGGGLDANF